MTLHRIAALTLIVALLGCSKESRETAPVDASTHAGTRASTDGTWAQFTYRRILERWSDDPHQANYVHGPVTSLKVLDCSPSARAIWISFNSGSSSWWVRYEDGAAPGEFNSPYIAIRNDNHSCLYLGAGYREMTVGVAFRYVDEDWHLQRADRVQ